MTPSEIGAARRLHPVSVLFMLASSIRSIAVPFVLVLFGSRGSDAILPLIPLVFLVPVSISTIVGYFRFTYTYGEDELIIRSGLLFRRERHIPYGRIQNIDATQNIAHAVFGVYVVALETGGGGETEATLKVLPEAALTEMRRRVFEGRRAPGQAPAAEGATVEGATLGEPAPPAHADVLLRLGLRDLAICGFVRGRGLLLLGAIVGFAFDFGVDDRVFESAEDPRRRGPIARAIRQGLESLSFNAGEILLALVVFALLVLVLRLLSVIYTIQKLYGFTLVDAGGELRMAYGTLTRVKATIPLRRIQTVTLREGPLHRFFGVSSVRADTAGADANVQMATGREWLAPIISRAELPALLARLLPGAGPDGDDWVRPHHRAARRATVRYAYLPAALFAFFAVWFRRPEPLLMLVPIVSAAYIVARFQMRRMAYRVDDERFVFRSGWIWRHVTIAPLAKVQAAGIVQTPFDRRHGTASLIVDTAGAAGAPHRLHVPYVDAAAASMTAAHLGRLAARAPLNW